MVSHYNKVVYLSHCSSCCCRCIFDQVKVKKCTAEVNRSRLAKLQLVWKFVEYVTVKVIPKVALSLHVIVLGRFAMFIKTVFSSGLNHPTFGAVSCVNSSLSCTPKPSPSWK